MQASNSNITNVKKNILTLKYAEIHLVGIIQYVHKIIVTHLVYLKTNTDLYYKILL